MEERVLDGHLVGVVSCNDRLYPIFCEITMLAVRQRRYESDTPEYEELEKCLVSARLKAERIFYAYHPELKVKRKDAKEEDTSAVADDDLDEALAEIRSGALKL